MIMLLWKTNFKYLKSVNCRILKAFGFFKGLYDYKCFIKLLLEASFHVFFKKIQGIVIENEFKNSFDAYFSLKIFF